MCPKTLLKPCTFTKQFVWIWSYVTCKLPLTLFTRMLSADNRLKVSIFFWKNFQNSNYHCHIWIQYEKCIQMSTNKLSITDALGAGKAPWIWKMFKFQLFELKLCTVRHLAQWSSAHFIWCGRSPDQNLYKAKISCYVCCALEQGTLLSFAPPHPGELNGYPPRLET